MKRPSLPGFALLPIRFFFGFTFVWAGLDKLLDPSFLDPAAATSLHAQLTAFARVSPLGGMIQASLPYSVEIGAAIAIAEIGAGLGALTGLAFRVAAAGGLLLSLMFWLTASWSVHPYYLGADLPYAFGWLALLIAGHGGLLVPRRLRSSAENGAASSAVRGAAPDEATSPARRVVLQTIALGALAAAVATVAGSLRVLGVLVGGGAPAGSGSSGSRTGGGATASPDQGATARPSAEVSAAPKATIPADGIPVAHVAEVKRNRSVAFKVPFDAPAPLPAGDPGVIVQLADGSFVAFDAVCTHAGCTVEWSRNDELLICPCHDAMFDPEREAAVLGGPAPSPLTSLPLFVDAATGEILLVPSA